MGEPIRLKKGKKTAVVYGKAAAAEKLADGFEIVEPGAEAQEAEAPKAKTSRKSK